MEIHEEVKTGEAEEEKFLSVWKRCSHQHLRQTYSTLIWG